MFRVSGTAEWRAQWENDVFGDKLPDESHGWIIDIFFDIIEHRVNIIKLAHKISKTLWWQLFNNIIGD